MVLIVIKRQIGVLFCLMLLCPWEYRWWAPLEPSLPNITVYQCFSDHCYATKSGEMKNPQVTVLWAPQGAFLPQTGSGIGLPHSSHRLGRDLDTDSYTALLPRGSRETHFNSLASSGRPL